MKTNLEEGITMHYSLRNAPRRSSRLYQVATAAIALLIGLTALPAGALNIVLTNDDGFNSTGIQAMKSALVAAGHNVVLSAPQGEQSGSSAAINIEGLLVTQQGPQDFSVARADNPAEAGEPATSALIGISLGNDLFGNAPDLLVSGINSGANIGAATQISGTVGAVISAIASGIGGIRLPALGISTDERCDPEDPDPLTPEECDELNAQHFAQVAAFLVEVVDQLEVKTGRSNSFSGLLPPGVALNINYPPLAPHELAGAKIVEQGKDLVLGGAVLDLTYDCLPVLPCDGPVRIFAPAIGIPEGSIDSKKKDTVAFRNGYITIVPIEADYTASPSNLRSTKSLLGKLAGNQ